MSAITWLPFAFLTILGMAGYATGMKFSGGDTNPFLFSAIINGAAFVLNLLFLFVIPVARDIPITSNKTSVILGLLCGVAAICIDLGYFLMVRNNPAALTTGSSLIAISNLALILLIGVAFFHEKMSWQNMLGVLFAFIAVVLLTYRQPVTN